MAEGGRMNDARLLAKMGTDASAWVDEFRRLHPDLVTDGGGVMLGWFANAIEAGRSAGYASGFSDGMAEDY